MTLQYRLSTCRLLQYRLSTCRLLLCEDMSFRSQHYKSIRHDFLIFHRFHCEVRPASVDVELIRINKMLLLSKKFQSQHRKR